MVVYKCCGENVINAIVFRICTEIYRFNNLITQRFNLVKQKVWSNIGVFSVCQYCSYSVFVNSRSNMDDITNDAGEFPDEIGDFDIDYLREPSKLARIYLNVVTKKYSNDDYWKVDVFMTPLDKHIFTRVAKYEGSKRRGYTALLCAGYADYYAQNMSDAYFDMIDLIYQVYCVLPYSADERILISHTVNNLRNDRLFRHSFTIPQALAGMLNYSAMLLGVSFSVFCLYLLRAGVLRYNEFRGAFGLAGSLELSNHYIKWCSEHANYFFGFVKQRQKDLFGKLFGYSFVLDEVEEGELVKQIRTFIEEHKAEFL